ncbi:MAG: hypothetical protein LH660_01500 [Phormidesmis sp. CAN_BIN36]|nr:hypothetical protein [Phormidesmis sp. CAN_BIN36]
MPNEWQRVQRVLVIDLEVNPVTSLSPALKHLKQVLSGVLITLLGAPEASEAALLLPEIDQILLHRSLKNVSNTLSCDPAFGVELIQILKSEHFDAAILLSHGQSPYPLGYLCYLAEIPIRVGVSREFGGRVLSHWVNPIEHDEDCDRHLWLLKSVGLTTPVGVNCDHEAIELKKLDSTRR